MSKTRKRNVHVSGRRRNGAHRTEYVDGIRRGENLEAGDPQHLVPLCLKTASSKVNAEVIGDDWKQEHSYGFFGHGTEVIWADADETFLLPRLRDTKRAVQVRDKVWRTRHTNWTQIGNYQRQHRHLGTTMAMTREGLSGMAAVKNRDLKNKRLSIQAYRNQAEALKNAAREHGIDVESFFRKGGTLAMLGRVAQYA